MQLKSYFEINITLISHVASELTSGFHRPLENCNPSRLEFMLKGLKVKNSMVFYFVTIINNFNFIYSVTCRKLFSQTFL
jgi:hypothetical protein